MTSRDLSSPDASFGSSSAAVRLVMANSSGVSQPDVSGQAVTSACEAGESRSSGTRHSGGMESARAALFLAAIASQLGCCSCCLSPPSIVTVAMVCARPG